MSLGKYLFLKLKRMAIIGVISIGQLRMKRSFYDRKNETVETLKKSSWSLHQKMSTSLYF